VNHKFVKFPKTWQACLAEQRADGSTYRVALYLLDKASFSENVPLGNKTTKAFCGNGRSRKRIAPSTPRSHGPASFGGLDHST
jgi:hypothetical protein